MENTIYLRVLFDMKPWIGYNQMSEKKHIYTYKVDGFWVVIYEGKRSVVFIFPKKVKGSKSLVYTKNKLARMV